VGADNSASELCRGVDLDSNGNIFCVGFTSGDIGEIGGGGTDAFVMKLSPLGVLQKVTQYGAATSVTAGGDNSSHDHFIGLAVAPNGNLNIAGSSYGPFASPKEGGNEDALLISIAP
jgi:hypothetical protein